MNIYKITRPIDRDGSVGLIIVANNDIEAIQIAVKTSEESQEMFVGMTLTEEGIYTGKSNAPFVLLEDYKEW